MSGKGSAGNRSYNPITIDGKLLLTIKETAALLRLSPQTLYNRTRKKSDRPFPLLPIRCGGGHPRFRTKDVLDYIESLTPGGDHD